MIFTFNHQKSDNGQYIYVGHTGNKNNMGSKAWLSKPQHSERLGMPLAIKNKADPKTTFLFVKTTNMPDKRPTSHEN